MKLKQEVKDWLFVISILLFWIMFGLILKFGIFQVETEQEAPFTLLQVEYQVPCSTSSVKTYMDYKAITSQTSDQYIYIQEHMTIRQGYLMDEQGYIGVALGSQFGEIGSKWIFELDTGNSIYAVKIEHKDDSDTINGCEHKIDKSVIEFVIDENYFPIGENGYIYNGNFDNNEWWNGNIESVEKK